MITATVVLSFLGFIALGLPDGLLGVAWPSVRSEFSQPIGAIAFLLAGGSIGYFFASTGFGRIVRVLGLAGALAGGTFLIAAGLALVSVAPWWWALVPGFALVGIGGGLVDTGFNVYAAHHFSATTMNWMHACYGLGATIGPPVMTFFLLNTGSWRPAYGVSAVFLATIAVSLVFARGRLADHASEPVIEVSNAAEDASEAGGSDDSNPRFLIWGGVAVFFLYTGLEVSAGQLSFTLLTEGRGVTEVSAGFWVSAFWISLTAGRILLGPLSHRVGSRLVLRYAFVLAGAAALIFTLELHPVVDGLALSLLGFSLASVFPLLVLLTPERVGPARAHDVIGYQMGAATVGAVLLAGGGGTLAGAFGPAVVAPFILLMAILCGGLYTAVTLVQRRAGLYGVRV